MDGLCLHTVVLGIVFVFVKTVKEFSESVWVCVLCLYLDFLFYIDMVGYLFDVCSKTFWYSV